MYINHTRLSLSLAHVYTHTQTHIPTHTHTYIPTPTITHTASNAAQLTIKKVTTSEKY